MGVLGPLTVLTASPQAASDLPEQCPQSVTRGRPHARSQSGAIREEGVFGSRVALVPAGSGAGKLASALLHQQQQATDACRLLLAAGYVPR